MTLTRTPCALLCALALTAGACEEKPAPAAPAKTPITLGVLPALDAAAVKKTYAPLAQAIEGSISRPVSVVVPSNYEDLIAKLRAGELNLAQLSAAAFVRVRGVISGQVIAQQRPDYASAYRGAFVAKEGAFPGLKALEGKRFAYVDEQSSAGYWFPRMRLRQNGFDPDTLFGEVTFAGSHAAVLEAIRDGKVDAGAVSEQTVAGAADLEVLEVTNPIPDDVLVAVTGLSQQEQENVRALLLDAAASPMLGDYLKARRIREFRRHNFDEYALLEMELRASGSLLGAAP